jgi:two-component system sensor histidine kinase YesM
MTVPLKTVTQKIKMVGKGDFETKLPDFNTVELMEISSAFNEMTSKIHYLITQVYESNLLAKESQIKYLQSQMQPHFLFNVLSVVGMKAQMSGNEEIYKMIYSLSKLIQGKIFRNDELLIPLSEELALVKFYLYLQSQRFEDKLSYQVDLEEPLLMSVKIPRLCIEPIVENAVIHGLEPKEEAGHVSVRVYLQGNNLRIDVEDNGVGFVKDGASDWEPIEATSSSEHTQMGIKNTQRLINNLYGEEYGLTVRSEVGIGTVVSILLPLIKESKQNVESNDRR